MFGSVRNKADAERLSTQFGAGFTPLFFDVTDAQGIKAAAAFVGEQLRGQRLSGLVNNAGIAATGPLLEIAPDAVRSAREVNLIGPLMVTQAFAPLLGVDPALSRRALMRDIVNTR